jgi:hypothetical protein
MMILQYVKKIIEWCTQKRTNREIIMSHTPEKLAEAYLDLWEKFYEECLNNHSYLDMWDSFLKSFNDPKASS